MSRHQTDPPPPRPLARPDPTLRVPPRAHRAPAAPPAAGVPPVLSDFGRRRLSEPRVVHGRAGRSRRSAAACEEPAPCGPMAAPPPHLRGSGLTPPAPGRLPRRAAERGRLLGRLRPPRSAGSQGFAAFIRDGWRTDSPEERGAGRLQAFIPESAIFSI